METVRRPVPISRRTRQSDPTARGFSLIELMVSVGISSAIALVTGGIIVNAVKTLQTAGNKSEASSVVNNIRAELSDAKYASTVTVNSTGQAVTTGCVPSFSFDPSVPGSTVLTNLNSGTCVPVQIKLTRTGGTIISEAAASSTEQSAQGTTYVKFLEYCNASEVQASAASNTYTGELFITQNIENSSTLGQLTESVMGAGYGARQYVSRVVVGVNPADGSITSCDAATNSQLNGDNCQLAGMTFNTTTQKCQIYPVQTTSAAMTVCNPVTQIMYQDGQTSHENCVDVDSACSDGGSSPQTATVAGGFVDGKLDCDRPRYVPPNITSVPPTYTPPATTPIDTAALTTGGPTTSQPIPAAGVTDSSGATVPGSSGANINTTATAAGATTVPAQCQAAITNYIECLAVDSIILAKHIDVIEPVCNGLENLACLNTNAILTDTSSGTGNVTSSGSAASYAVQNAGINTTSCTCGSTAGTPNIIPNGSYCGYCTETIDPGYGTYESVQKVEKCEDGDLVPQPGATIGNASATTCGTTVVYDRRPLIGPNMDIP